MSLNWDLSAVKNMEEVCFVERDGEDGPGRYLNGITNSIIWGCLIVGIGTITEKGWEEWHLRYTLADRANGPYVKKGGEAYRLTREDVKAHIGLKTNVFPKENDAKFLKKIMSTLKGELTRYGEED